MTRKRMSFRDELSIREEDDMAHLVRLSYLKNYEGKRELLRGYAGCDRHPCYPRGEQCVICCHRKKQLP